MNMKIPKIAWESVDGEIVDVEDEDDDRIDLTDVVEVELT